MTDLNSLAFGNPNRTQVIYLNQETFLDSLFKELSSHPYPSNDGEEVNNELSTLLEYTHQLNSNTTLLNRYQKYYDSTFEEHIIYNLLKSGVDEKELTELVTELHKDIVPLLVKLKFHYQRPRPHQLAYYKGVQLVPFKSKTADSPAYPCGHCYQAKIYAEVLGNKYPKFYKPLKELADDISVSRLYMGVHYPSDTEFANYVVDVVLSHPDFRKKYKL